MKKKLLAAAIGVALMSTSCLGPNKTFNDLNDWNDQVTENEWANEVIFLGLNVIPVYGIAYLADIVVFNSVEFWKE